MSYRDDRPDPPLCDCGEPAVAFAEMFGCFVCPRRHLFDADLDRYRGCKLAGPEHLDPLPKSEPTLRERIGRWWSGQRHEPRDPQTLTIQRRQETR